MVPGGIGHGMAGDTFATKALTGTATTAGGGSAGAAKALSVGGTIWSGNGFSLGLGIGLGAWGPRRRMLKLRPKPPTKVSWPVACNPALGGWP